MASTAKHPKKTKKPSQPLSGYNLYFRFERLRLLSTGKSKEDLSPVTLGNLRDFVAKNPYEAPSSRKKRAHSKTHGSISFTDLSRTVSTNWRTLDAESKEPFQIVAHELKVDYYRKLEDERRRAKAAKMAESKGKAFRQPGQQRSYQVCTPLLAPTPRIFSNKGLNMPKNHMSVNSRVQMDQFTSFPESPVVPTSEWSLDTPLDDSISETNDLDELPLESPEGIDAIAQTNPQQQLPAILAGDPAIGQTEMLRKTSEFAIEPLALRHVEAHGENSLVLRKYFADAWLAKPIGVDLYAPV